VIVIPAVDVKEGRCVRLREGRADAETVFSEDPVAMATQWAAQGAPRLHVVDLDGAFGAPRQTALVAKIVAAVAPVRVEVGGGLRDIAAVESVLEAGAGWVAGVLATDTRGVFQVPRAMNAALSDRKVVCASGYSVAAVAPLGVHNTSSAGDSLFAAFLHGWLSTGNAVEALSDAVVFAGWRIGHRDPTSVLLTEPELAPYAGRYRTANGVLDLAVEGDGLVANVTYSEEAIAKLRSVYGDQIPEQRPVPMKLLPEDRFVVVEGPAKGLRGYFVREDGAVSGVDFGGRLARRLREG